MNNQLKEFVIEVFGNSIVEKIYAGLAGAGGLSVLVQILGILPFESQSSAVSGAQSGPIFWQLLIAMLVLVSHGQKNFAQLDKDTNPGIYFVWRFVEAIAIVASFLFIGLFLKYNEALLPLAFFGLALMLFSIMFRRILTDSLEPCAQILRFISACWFVLVGIWMGNPVQETTFYIEAFSGFLFFLYLVLIYSRYRKNGSGLCSLR